jgi:hypothetical protein
MATDIGTGSTVVFGTSGFTADILGVNLPDITRESINTSHMGTTGSHTFTLADLVDNGTLDLEIAWVAGLVPPILTNAAMETVTVSFAGSASTWSFSCGQTQLGIAIPFEDKMTANCTFKISGNITRN